jgi:hypothetical protein
MLIDLDVTMCERRRRFTDFRHFFLTPVFSSPRWIQEVVLPKFDHEEKRRPTGADSGERQVWWLLLLLKAIVFFCLDL